MVLGEGVMKKGFVIFLFLLGVFSFMNENTYEQNVRIGVLFDEEDERFKKLYRKEIEAYSNHGREVTIMDEVNGRLSNMNQEAFFFKQNYDVLIVYLTRQENASEIISKCIKASIPCIFLNQQPREEEMKKYEGKIAYVGVDIYQFGRMQGEIVAQLEDKGDLNHDGVLQYLMVGSDFGSEEMEYRTRYCIEQYYQVSGNQVEEMRGLYKKNESDQVQQDVVHVLAEYEKEIEVIFCNDDFYAFEIVQAIRESGRVVGEDIYLVGVDAFEKTLELVSENEMSGTVLKDYKKQVEKAIDVAIQVSNDEKMYSYYWMDHVKITPLNVKEFIQER